MNNSDIKMYPIERDGEMSMNHVRKVAVVYHYFEKNDLYRDNFIFFLARAWRADLEFFIVISGQHSVKLPTQKNIRYVHTQNFGHDFGSVAVLTESGALDGYDYLIFANCTVRGPLLPNYVTNCWTLPFISLLKDEVHLCGSTINILHDTRPYHDLYNTMHPADPKPYSHVQSSTYAMTSDCFAFLRAKDFYGSAINFDKSQAIVDCEIAMSQIVKRNGWNISCLLPPYSSIDYRAPHSEINPSTKTGHPQASGAYFGQTPHPFELIFIKTEWNLISKSTLDFYSLMALQYHPTPTLEWAESIELGNRVAESIGGEFSNHRIRQSTREEKTMQAPEITRNSKPQARCIMVLGMHRSGTSALAGALTLLGVSGPKTPMSPHASNPKGFFESIPVRDFNDALLASADSTWKDWRAISHEWFTSSHAQSKIDPAITLIDQEFGDGNLFVLKDPRICRLLPFWRQVFGERGTQVLALHTHRDPNEVAGSLANRYNFDPALTHLLWLRHLIEAEAASRGLSRHFINYSQLLKDPVPALTGIGRKFGLSLPVETIANEISSFLGADLRNHQYEGEAELPHLGPWYHECLTIFERWSASDANDSDTAHLDAIRAEFDRATLAFAPIVNGSRAVKSKSA